MFDSLQGKLQDVFRRLKGEGTVSQEVLDSALRQIRMALLEADVNFLVVKSFVARIRDRALGQEVLRSLTPAQQVIKIVRDELNQLLGEAGEEIKNQGSPTITLLCGLQGAGKTTTAAKLALRLRKQGRNPLLVAADLQRAAAIEQLRQVGSQAGVSVLTPTELEESSRDLRSLGRRALATARERGHDHLIIDSAGRLHVDEVLMEELTELATLLTPHEILFVADAMTGQDAVRSAQEFNSNLALSGVILTKLDGDTRGGAALSIRSVASVPIRYTGTGERLENLDLFHPDRLASRILGMGDVLSLIERAEEGLDAQETERLARRLARREFTLEDLRDQLRQMRKLGPLSQVLELMPKVGPLKGLDSSAVDEGQFRKVEAIINSMTPLERRKPALLNAKRKKRISKGSGTRVQDINRLLKQYQMMRKLMKSKKGKWLRQSMGL